MAAIRTYAFGVLLLHILAALLTSSAAVTDGLAGARARLALQEPKYRQISPHSYEMLIDADEERRIVELLGPEYLDVGLVATRVTGPPRACPVCGKQTEFVDWVFTALARGIHSPEFILESLRQGNPPRKRVHDVYCSGCGHLTQFQDSTGEEGGAPYLALATPYDRVRRTFGESVYKRGHDVPHKKRDESTYGWDTISCIAKRDDFERETKRHSPDLSSRDEVPEEKRDESTYGWDTISCLTKRDDLENRSPEEVPDKKRNEETYGWDTISCLTKRADLEREARDEVVDKKRDETTYGWDTISCLTKRADLVDEVADKKRDEETYGWDTISCLTKRTDLEREASEALHKREEETYGWDTISCLTKRSDLEGEAK
ncbi:hypothetical protein C8Q73DRAFT_468890 [Cubamyces lactineus]|nr:hypothetical protein C8Q73DRAFT_468890 [Cubamyces lactineus]